MNILVLCQRKRSYGKDKNKVKLTVNKIKQYVATIFTPEKEKYSSYWWLSENDDNINSVDFNFFYSMYNYNTQNFVKVFKNYFDLVILNTCPLFIFSPYDFYGIYNILNNNGCLLLTSIVKDKIKYDTMYNINSELSSLHDITKEQILYSFKIQTKNGITKLIKNKYKENIYKNLVKEMYNTKIIKNFDLIFNSFPLSLKHYMYYNGTKYCKNIKSSKCKDFVMKIGKSYDKYIKNKKNERNIKIIKKHSELLTEREKKEIQDGMKDCFNISYSFEYVKGYWLLLKYKKKIESFMLIEKDTNILWNVCTITNSRRKGFAAKLMFEITKKSKVNLTLYVRKKQDDIKLIKFYNSFGFIYYNQTSEDYILKRNINYNSLCLQKNDKDRYVDLNSIKIKGSEELPLWFIKYNIDHNINIKRVPILNYYTGTKIIELKIHKILGYGSSGIVYLYMSKNKKYKVSLKIIFNNDDFIDEKNIINNLEKSKITCDVINAKAISNSEYKIIVMEYAKNTLSNINYSINNSIKILKELTNILSCLYDKKFIYTDFSPDNILYRCIDSNIKLILTDFGSICKIGKKRNFYNFRGSIDIDKIGSNKNKYFCSLNFSVWKLATFFIDLILDERKFYPNIWWKLNIGSSDYTPKGLEGIDYIYYDNLKKYIAELKLPDNITELLQEMYLGYDSKNKIINFKKILKKLS